MITYTVLYEDDGKPMYREFGDIFAAREFQDSLRGKSRIEGKVTRESSPRSLLLAVMKQRDEARAEAVRLREALADLLAATAANYLPGIPELEDAQHQAQAALGEQKGEQPSGRF